MAKVVFRSLTKSFGAAVVVQSSPFKSKNKGQPLPDDAAILDTTNMTIDAAIGFVLERFRAKMAEGRDQA